MTTQSVELTGDVFEIVSNKSHPRLHHATPKHNTSQHNNSSSSKQQKARKQAQKKQRASPVHLAAAGTKSRSKHSSNKQDVPSTSPPPDSTGNQASPPVPPLLRSGRTCRKYAPQIQADHDRSPRHISANKKQRRGACWTSRDLARISITEREGRPSQQLLRAHAAERLLPAGLLPLQAELRAEGVRARVLLWGVPAQLYD